MATADELLAGMSSGDDTTLVIDNYLRTINIPKTITNLGVEHDDEVLILNFKMPRYLDDTDLSTFSIRINYINANGDGDVYTVNDNKKTVGSDYITFSWLVGPTATAYKGITSFNVCMKTLTSEGYIDKEYNTTVARLPVLEGLEVDEGIVSQYSDILEQWKNELFGIGDTEEANMRAVSQVEQENIVKKGAEVLATIPQDYQTTVKMAEEGIRTKADAIVCTAEGETITVSDSSDDHLRGLRVFGKTTQAKTTGIQLFNPYAQQNNSFGNATISGNGSEITVIGTYYVSWPIVLKAGVTYYVNFETAGTGTQRAVRFEYGDKEITNTLTNPGIFTPTRDTVSVYLYSGLGTENCVVYKNFQISEGSSPVPWEPYSAGYTSPSPNWPQPLCSVESPEIGIVGKNLLDMSVNGYYVDGVLKIPYTSYNSIAGGFNKIRVYPGRTYTFSYKFTTGDRVIFNFLDKDNQRIGDVKIGWGQYLLVYNGRYGAVGNGATFTIPEDSNVAYVDVRMCQMNECGEGNLNYYYDLQFEEGPVATEYEPYKALPKITAPYTLNSIPVDSGGNYTDASGQQWICDEIDFERGVYIQRCYTETLMFIYQEGLNCYSASLTHTANAACGIEQGIPVLSNILPFDPACGSGNPMVNGIRVATSSPKYAIAYYNDRVIKDVDVVYPLATPIETPLTAEEIAAFKALHTNYPHTAVLNDAGAHMELKYNVDTKTYIDNGIKQTVSEVMEAIENGSY